MKKNVLNILKKLVVGVLGFFIMAIIFVWLSGETEIGDIKIKNGQGVFEHEAITVGLNVSEFAEGNIIVSENSKVETNHLLEADYTSDYSYRLSGNPTFFNGEITVTFPLDEALLSQYSMDDLKQGLYIVTEEAAFQKDGDETTSPTLYPATINEKTQTVSTTISYETLDALGGFYETQRPSFSFFKTAFAQDNTTAPTMSINISVRYFPKLEQVKSKHFVLHDIDKNMPTERYKKLLTKMESFFTTIRNVGLNTDEIDFPIHVYLDDDLETGANVQYGEMDMFISTRRRANLNLNKKLLTKATMTPEEIKEMETTAGHELFHIIQQNYWRRGHSVFSVETFAWPDETMAVAFEMLIAKNATPSVMDNNTNTLWNSSIANYNDFESDFYKRQSYGYGLSYMMQYLVKTHPRGKRIIGDFYKSLANEKEPKTAFNNILAGVGGAEQFWLTFINKEMTEQSAIHHSASMNKNVNIFFGKGDGSDENPSIVFSKGRVDRSAILKSNKKNKITFEANLPNLSADVVLLQLSARDETIKALMKTLGRKYMISVSGDDKTGVMVYHIPYGQKNKNARLKSSSLTNNLIKPGQSIELTDLMRTHLVLVNCDGNIANPTKRKVSVTVTFQSGESFDALENPPVRDDVDEKALQTLEQWYKFCKKQAEPQQQSNTMLMNYYKNKANEIQKAIALLKNGTNIYTELDLVVKPDDPKTMINKVEKSISNIEDKQDYAFNSMIKLDEALSNPTPEIEADKALYKLSVDFFDYRQVAYGHLLDYLNAVKNANEVDNSKDDIVQKTKPNNKPKHSATFYLGSWKHYRQIDGDCLTKKGNANYIGTFNITKNSVSFDKPKLGIYKALSFKNIPYNLTLKSTGNGGTIAEIETKANRNASKGGSYCQGNDCLYFKISIYENSYGEVDLSFRNETTNESYFTNNMCYYLKR